MSSKGDTNSKKDSKPKSGKPKPMTPSEIEVYIKSCIKIPRSSWTSIPDNSQICYFKKDGKFVKSGFVKLSYSKNGNDFIRYGSKLSPMAGDKYYREFTINLSNISQIYKKVSQDAIWEYKLIRLETSKKMEEFETKLAEMQERVDQSENSAKKIVKLIKRLHKIQSLDDLASLQ